MKLRRIFLLVVGIGAAVVGFVMMVDRRLAGSLAVEKSALLVIAALALLQGYRIVQSRRYTPTQLAETSDPETEQDLDVPGDDFDQMVSDLYGFRPPGATASHRGRDFQIWGREEIRDRLEAEALSTITRKYGVTEQQAERALATGTWTDDPIAAAFFTGEVSVPATRRLRLSLSPGNRFQRRANRAAEAIADLSAADEVGSLEVRP